MTDFDWVFVICLFVCLTFDLVWTEYAVIRHRMVSESLRWPYPYPFLLLAFIKGFVAD